jgi:hypothetical protein
MLSKATINTRVNVGCDVAGINNYPGGGRRHAGTVPHRKAVFLWIAREKKALPAALGDMQREVYDVGHWKIGIDGKFQRPFAGNVGL